MFRLSSSLRLSLRSLYTSSGRADHLLDQLKSSTNKYDIFQLVGIFRPILTVEHVNCAMNLLWQFHKVKQPNELKIVDHIPKHPEFGSLCTVAENNINLMEDGELVDILKVVDSFQVDAHSSLVQRLVTEGWRRLERLDLLSLSTFAACLRRQNMTTSPLMGQIASIVDSCLDDVEDPAMLLSLVCSIYAVSSLRLQERLIIKAGSIVEKLDDSHLQDALQLMQVCSVDKYGMFLMMKCDRLFQKYASALDPQTVCKIMKVYQFLHFTNYEFNVVAMAKLMEEVDRCDHPGSFSDLFVALGPIVSFEMRERLFKRLLSFADDMSLNDVLKTLPILEIMECTNTELLNKICSRLRKQLGICSSNQLCSIVETMVFLDFHDDHLHTDLQIHLKRCILSSFIPSDVAEIFKAMCLGPKHIDEVILSKVDGIIAQCNCYDLSQMTYFVLQLLEIVGTPHENTLNKLLKRLNSYRWKRVHEAKCLDSLLNELTVKKVALAMDTVLIEATLLTCQRLIHQLSWRNVGQFSFLVLRTDTLCPPLMDEIAAVTMDNLNEMYPPTVYPILRVFSYLNFQPSQGKDFFNACTQHVLNYMDSMPPHALVLTAYVLALAGYFPKELIMAIFNINFLRRLDAQLNAFVFSKNRRLRECLMELNRAICIEHPEYGVPWFHEHYCQQLLQPGIGVGHRYMNRLLGEIFGGTNYTKMLVQVPYGYSIDFEFVLDKKRTPIAYVEEDALSSGPSMCATDSQLQKNNGLPAGAQRIAMDYYRSTCYTRNSSHVKGVFAMKKRHLEILGYRVIQIPVYEWRDASLTAKVDRTNYLRKKIFEDDVCTV